MYIACMTYMHIYLHVYTYTYTIACMHTCTYTHASKYDKPIAPLGGEAPLRHLGSIELAALDPLPSLKQRTDVVAPPMIVPAACSSTRLRCSAPSRCECANSFLRNKQLSSPSFLTIQFCSSLSYARKMEFAL
jgi:hypothetical protein